MEFFLMQMQLKAKSIKKKVCKNINGIIFLEKYENSYKSMQIHEKYGKSGTTIEIFAKECKSAQKYRTNIS